MRTYSICAALLTAAPAAAQEGPWRVSADRAELPAAKIALPTRIAGLALVKTGESTEKGSGLDDYAQFESADRKLFATAYVYRTTYPDAALAAYGTDRAVRGRFPTARVASQTVVALAGRPRTAIRSVYEGATLAGASITTAAAFARVGDWVLKLRASGPAERAAEVTGALDALLSGLTVDGAVVVPAAKPLAFAAPCPADGSKAKMVKGDDAVGASILSGLIGTVSDGGKGPAPFPANGATPVCVRGALALGEQRLDLLQPVAEAEPSRVIAMLNDAGAVLSVEPAIMGKGYTIKTYVVGAVETRGTLDRVPRTDQIAGWLLKPQNDAMRVRSRANVVRDGKLEITVDPKTFR
jgi:hypothetical protein